MRCLLILLSLHLFFFTNAQDFLTPFEQSPNTTATYLEAIAFYGELAKKHPKQIQLSAHGSTDSGYPLHTLVLSKDGNFDPVELKKEGKLILFINNAIHAGEPCGVDASMMLIRDLLQQKKKKKWLENTVIVLIPFYNIGGGLNRGSYSRANQEGPHEHGFRGNAKNLDLNRDFIKCDSRNAQTFNQIYQKWLPDVFIDNHTSNGADYQYTLTLIATQSNKLDQHLSSYMNEKMLPSLYQKMEAKDWEMTPYVYARNTPDDGIAAFLDLPRYSSGYAALHNAISFMPETHMLKPFEDRVRSTYYFMETMLEVMHEQKEVLQSAKQKALANTRTKPIFDLNWAMDTEQKDFINFKGYKAKYRPSAISGIDRLYYDRNEPYEKVIPYFKTYRVTEAVQKPYAYVIPQAYYKVIERLKWNGVEVKQLTKDVELPVELYRIEDFKTRDAYEGHYLHYDVKVEKENQEWLFRKGDYIIYTNQVSNRYIIETLEPQAPDSFFAWNFFDGILMQKEYFSSYVFEDTALELLDQNPDLKLRLQEKQAKDEAFAKDARAQLDFIYKNSPYYEPTHRIYPVGRVLEQYKSFLE